MECPFNHSFQTDSFLSLLSHLSKCIKGANRKIYFCPLNATHLFLEENKLKAHTAICSDKNENYKIPENLFKEFFVVSLKNILVLQNRFNNINMKIETKTEVQGRSDKDIVLSNKKNNELKISFSEKESENKTEFTNLIVLKPYDSNFRFIEIPDLHFTKIEIGKIFLSNFSLFLRKSHLAAELSSADDDLFSKHYYLCYSNYSLIVISSYSNLIKISQSPKLANIGVWIWSIPNFKSLDDLLGTLNNFNLSENAGSSISNDILDIKIQKYRELNQDQDKKLKAVNKKIHRLELTGYQHTQKIILEEIDIQKSKLLELFRITKENKSSIKDLIDAEKSNTMQILNEYKIKRVKELNLNVSAIANSYSALKEELHKLEKENELLLKDLSSVEISNKILEKSLSDENLQIKSLNAKIKIMENELISSRKNLQNVEHTNNQSRYCHVCLICDKSFTDVVSFPCLHLNKFCYKCLDTNISQNKCCICHQKVFKYTKVTLDFSFNSE